MKKIIISAFIVCAIALSWSFLPGTPAKQADIISFTDSLRRLYERPPGEWPRPFVDDSIAWQELAALPESPFANDNATKDVAGLGKTLFFDPRLSGSNQISCASCHEPELGWTNGRRVGVGHDHKQGSRNVPSLFNIWASKQLFWDGRAGDLEQQAAVPIENKDEMHAIAGDLAEELESIPGYKEKFKEVFGEAEITVDKITWAIATYERTITSRKAPFDFFMAGRYKALTGQQVWGLHLFRTKARCMNCHNGPLFTDGQFHNIGLTYYGRKYEDLGLYNITRRKEDVGKFKTPSLRDVMLTRPWMHNGLFDVMEGIINIYDAGGSRPRRRPEHMNDPMFPETSPILVPLQLTKEEKEAIVAFLHSIGTSTSQRVQRPALPGLTKEETSDN